jgi:spermidine synthase
VTSHRNAGAGLAAAGSVAETVEREREPSSRGELALRRRGEIFEIVSNGVFLMDTSDGTSERLLAELATPPAASRVLIAGLGVGFTLAAVLSRPWVRAVTVVEVEEAVVRWNSGALAGVNGHALGDPRVEVVVAEVGAWIRSCDQQFDAICLDVDNGPDWTVTENNRGLYGVDGLTVLKKRLTNAGRLGVWGAGAAPEFEHRLAEVFDVVRTYQSPAANGPPDVVWIAFDLG